MWVCADDPSQAQRPFADRLQVRSAQPVLDRASDRRPKVQSVDENVDAYELLVAELLKFRNEAVARLERFGLDDELPEERVLKLLIER